MNRLEYLFGKKQNNILSVYFTAGHPHIDSTVPVIEALHNAGTDMIEVGVPFSDPMADGKTIQQSSATALRNGMNLELLFSQLADIRAKVADTPLILMGYLNVFMQYGIEALFRQCRQTGIDGLIIPDLPFDEYITAFKPLCDLYDIPVIMLITPETDDRRIRMIDSHCSGFIYMVSAAATTGIRDKFDSAQTDYFRHIDSLGLKHPRLIGFGISNPATFADAVNHSSGAIVGSLFIKCLEATDSPREAATMLLDTLGLPTAGDDRLQ